MIPTRTFSTLRVRGFSLVAAIFVLVILAALGLFIITISEVQRATSVGAAQSVRANFAAQSGLEWGIYQAVISSNCTASTTFSPAGAGWSDFSVTVGCTSSNHTEGPATTTVYVITSTATTATFGTRDYFARTLQATVTNAP
jgi:MSHA biogenesis protein MshP